MKYRLIDDPLCDLNEDIFTYENCEDCPYFWECMEEDDDERGEIPTCHADPNWPAPCEYDEEEEEENE